MGLRRLGVGVGSVLAVILVGQYTTPLVLKGVADTLETTWPVNAPACQVLSLLPGVYIATYLGISITLMLWTFTYRARSEEDAT